MEGIEGGCDLPLSIPPCGTWIRTAMFVDEGVGVRVGGVDEEGGRMGGVARDAWPALPEEEERGGGGGRVEEGERALFSPSSWTSAGMPLATFPFIPCFGKKREGRRNGRRDGKSKECKTVFEAFPLKVLIPDQSKEHRDLEQEVGCLPSPPSATMMMVVVAASLRVGQVKEETEED